MSNKQDANIQYVFDARPTSQLSVQPPTQKRQKTSSTAAERTARRVAAFRNDACGSDKRRLSCRSRMSRLFTRISRRTFGSTTPTQTPTPISSPTSSRGSSRECSRVVQLVTGITSGNRACRTLRHCLHFSCRLWLFSSNVSLHYKWR